MKVYEVLEAVEKTAPLSLAEDWDNCGLIIGDGGCEVTRILVALDVTRDVIEFAVRNSCELIVSHHPVIFNGIKNVPSSSSVYAAVKAGICVIAAHTCFDCAPGGVSCTLAEKIGLTDIYQAQSNRFLFLGDCDYADTKTLVKNVSDKLRSPVSYADSGGPVKRVAVCGGAGGEFVALAHTLGADAYVTGEASYHDFTAAKELGITLVTAGHFATEVIAVPVLAEKLSELIGTGAQVTVAPQSSPIEHYY